ncbi:L,D-transpeptidase family protein [Paracoccus aminophilus]|uniref:L,D-TPase catalytic domain-containing protein n=1 Tax=Paracoccus aminophilus JCM 7686 TaxID=1367847 RepID=S5Y2Z9_PARAH|nr:L,D-transpeptidase [Paracoccus aminophilus]AGT10120.1 hypothetical protein JCM7686_3084 [Paracoccus aminophilus JCM 7686]
MRSLSPSLPRVGRLLLAGALALPLAPASVTAVALTWMSLPGPAFAQATMEPGKIQRKITAADIETADYTSGDLPAGQSAITAKVQILLDRSGISPGVVDGWRGGMSESALKAFQRRAGLPVDGRMSPVVWQLLLPFASGPLTTEYTITDKDAEGLVDKIPTDYAEKAKMTSQGYTSILEKLAERFHMDEKFLQKLNPGVDFVPGVTIQATVPAPPIRGTVTRIIVDKQTRRVAAYDAKGNLLADYPATVGSSATPSPHGIHKVDAVALNPVYTYNPNKNFKQGNNDRVLVIPPGPNGPVGDVWIDLSEPTYGIHGTATPSRLFVNQSNGCVRLTNWDARELAHMVKANVTVVEFLDPGVSIADVTGVANSAAANTAQLPAALGAKRPLARPHLATAPDQAPDSAAVTLAAQAALQTVTPPAGATTTVVGHESGDLLATAIADAISPQELKPSAVGPTHPPRRTAPASAPASPPASTATPAPEPVPAATAPVVAPAPAVP